MVLKTFIRGLSLVWQVLWPARFPGPLTYVRRLVVMSLFLPPLLALQVVHALGFVLDEIVFRRYRRISVRAPVFVLGAPRSGTTFMHRLLASHPRFTTFSTWECLFAPSISERYLWRALAVADRWIGAPLARAVGWLECRVAGGMDDVHPVRLDAPEEDYFAFLPLLCCFILIVPFPDAAWIWRMGRFDRDVEPEERASMMTWYRRCLQKHLFVHGAERTLLSKNASFAGMARSLVDEFPDCRLVVCERDAVQVVASQFRSVSGGMRLFGVSAGDPDFRRRLLACLDFYYVNLDEVVARLPDERCVRVRLWSLSRETRQVVERISWQFDLEPSQAVARAVEAYEQRPRASQPHTRAPAFASGMNARELESRFAAWRHDEGIRL